MGVGLAGAPKQQHLLHQCRVVRKVGVYVCFYIYVVGIVSRVGVYVCFYIYIVGVVVF